MTQPQSPLTACLQALQEAAPELHILRDEPMARHTTFRVGGLADAFLEPASPEEVAAVVRACRAHQQPLLVVGNGSNLLVRDGGIRGVVLCLGRRLAAYSVEGVILTAQAGLLLSSASRAAAQAGLAGLAFAEGIPGSVGGGATMNAGAYGGEMAQVVHSIDVIDGRGELRTVPAVELDFAYRHSALQTRDWVATTVRFALAPSDRDAIQAEMREIAARRKDKQPLQYPSAGSTFKRPPGHFAAQLIDEAGLKGFSVGGAQVSEKHAGFVINTGGATAADILALIAEVRRRVLEKNGVTLEPEVRIVGEDG